ncbi:flagellar biosynthesis protein FlgI [Notoacmeibacter marinus]|uniref:Flagellar P-ring protein n=1 Tax=Notoacmeibacter marinus TaxID=1876515 RepID=A0A231V2R6_9HYPH|nr:flagellar basal body P-ring protein FlgI [Notoacmeibacter marinus]OXT02468.1 flagellar biosynthesis protein FlgI [Notoacmeibacter marinus]
MNRALAILLALALVLAAPLGASAGADSGKGGYSRLKDVASITGSRDNQLYGYGLVVGLKGTGDSLRNSPFTEQSMRSMLDNLGIATELGQMRSRNVAAVVVTANLPPFVRPGTRIDVTVSSLGDASSLLGGTLVLTPLKGADAEIYAAAQGQVVTSGYAIEGEAEEVSRGVPTAARIPNGAIVERAVAASFEGDNDLTVQLRNPDFTTAVRLTDSINGFARRTWSNAVAREVDARTISLSVPRGISPARFVAAIENIPVTVDQPARVVIDERTGTIVIGADVRISPVAISQGTLAVAVTELPQVVQPAPFSDGVTAVEPRSIVDVEQTDGPISIINGVSLSEIAAGLNRLGVKPTDTIAILQAIKSAGALQAELVLQ